MIALLAATAAEAPDLKRVLLEILVVLIAAKLAAEVAERVKVPAVLGEILAGILIGPSVLHLVADTGGVLTVLGELGVILLLLEVGMEMDLVELGRVGRAAVSVATVGVVCPFVLGGVAAAAFGEDTKTAIFIGAALTATSVGITARVFGDLRALATVEARTVLGAAVADDVMGLVILTVVVRIVTRGSVSAGLVVTTVGMALLFLVVATTVGLRLAPLLFDRLMKVSRSPGTLVAGALAFTLAFASLAQIAQLAPIIGAFVAGLALARTKEAGRIKRELTPVAHLFVPVFFLQIGIAADVKAMANPAVLGLAGLLLIAAVVGKLMSAGGLIGAPGDRLLVGLGMLPRGEVGLIFASLGLREGVLDARLYAALLLVVLATTLITPPILRARLLRLRDRSRAPAAQPAPAGGWLGIEDGVVILRATPPDFRALRLSLQAAALVADARPGPTLLDWLGSFTPDTPMRWDAAATTELLEILKHGSERSWRLLDTVGVLERALPELSAVIRRRQRDPFDLDPSAGLRWGLVESLKGLTASDPVARTEYEKLQHPERLLFAALLAETAGDAAAGNGLESPVAAARTLVKRLDLGAQAEEEVALLVGEADLLRSAASRADGLDSAPVVTIADHLGLPERARALFILSLAGDHLERWERDRLFELHRLVQEVLAVPELTGLQARNTAEARRLQAERLLEDEPARAALAAAPRQWLLVQDPASLARQAAMVVARSDRRRASVSVIADGTPGRWRIDVVHADASGLLARAAHALAAGGLYVEGGSVATWEGVAVQAFVVKANSRPDPATIRTLFDQALASPLPPGGSPGATVTWDDSGSPWTTRCTVVASDRSGLLADIAASFAAAGCQVHAARVLTTENGRAEDVFELTDNRGAKLGDQAKAAVEEAIQSGAANRRRPWFARRKTNGTNTDPKQSGYVSETATP